MTISVIFFIIVLSSGSFGQGHDSLVKKLLENYDKFSPPLNNSKSAVDVSIRISLTQILELNTKENFLKSSFNIRQQWQERFSWDSVAEGKDYIFLPLSSVWSPDLIIFNSAEAQTHDTSSMVKIWANGKVEYTLHQLTKTTCTSDSTYYPFDQQTCIVKVGSRIYNSNEVELSIHPGCNFVELSGYYLSSEWDLIELPIYLNKIYPAETDVTAYLTMRRKRLQIILVVLLPIFTLGMASIMTQLLPADSQGKAILDGIFFMGNLGYLFYYSLHVSGTTSTPWIIKLLLTTLSIQFLTFLSSIFVINWSNRDGVMPKIFQHLLLRILGKFILFGYNKEDGKQLSNTNELVFKMLLIEPNLNQRINEKRTIWRLTGEVLGIVFFILFSISLFFIFWFAITDIPYFFEVVNDAGAMPSPALK